MGRATEKMSFSSSTGGSRQIISNTEKLITVKENTEAGTSLTGETAANGTLEIKRTGNREKQEGAL